MIANVIAWSARNIVLIFVGAALSIAGGVYALRTLPLDAIPDLSDVQVIVFTDYPGQAPQVVEDQVTYPLTTSMLTVPKSKVVRGFSFFGVSFVYVIFEDGTDPYWARSRVLEYLNAAANRLPDGVSPSLGPDATGVGWVYQYALVAKELSLAELRSLQDWVVRFAVSKSEGVAEVASVGGFVKQYSIVVDPARLRAQNVSLSDIADAVRSSNRDVGGRTIELSEFEFMVRGKGYLQGIRDIESIVLNTSAGVPLRLSDVARVELVPDERRGITELNGDGEVASGIVLQRDGANALTVIENAKESLAAVQSSLPAGTEILPVYDRSKLIEAAIETLKVTLIEESIVVALVTIAFLLHIRSALVAIIMLPIGILIAFMAMRALGLGANIMSLGGIAIAIGAMIDAAIVMIENAHKHLERAPPDKPRAEVLIEAASEVGPALFFSLLIITVSFLPIFTLESQEGRLFGPLAFTKTFAMAAAALLSITLVPALMILFVRGRIVPEHKNPLNRLLIWIYRPVIAGVLKAKSLTILVAIVILGVTVWPVQHIGSEFMPDLDEGTLMYMPTTLPGLSVTKAAELMQTQDRIIKSFPEVESVFGKAGRALTATDPAPTEMFETIITLKPKSEWRPGVTSDSLKQEMDAALQFPGVSNAWTMPIRARIDMLSTGIRTPVGVKVYGTNLNEMEKVARDIETVLKAVPGTSSAYAERVIGGYYLDIIPDRMALGRYGLSIDDVQDVIGMALGSEVVTSTVEGRERYGVAIRYPRAFRSDPQSIARDVQVSLPGGGTVPLGEVAEVKLTRGATTIRTENGQLAVYIFVDIANRDLGGYVAEAQEAVAASVEMPTGYSVAWSGQFEYLERAKDRLMIVVPLTLALIFLLLYLNFKALTETLIVMLSLPFALVGGIWMMWWLGFNASVAVAVGFIALAGVAAETGVIMLIYLDHALRDEKAKSKAEGRAFEKEDLDRAIMIGAVERVRPKMMTVVAIMAGLVPILWSTGAGSEIMQRIAVPMIGGMVSSTLLTLIVIPAVYGLVKGYGLKRAREVSQFPASVTAEAF
ncbi:MULTISPECIES: efflux RND transporter permease subunit [Rhizobium/Agrobacterium group]|jgi:Cu(I)/Ag(I) efflux system membrane protein CusA/SilA|uniref:Efflux RND transporter permease subunit n=2 Tax=Agrobacterium tumefaciens complex TaxID=1183400 RepID=A0AAE6ENB1_AGRTU|nr:MULTISPECIES: CusA/CzcA family heavy metal efflux RND transporter [Rhizobium/Agrobacterium group]MCA2371199.1 efflux RND transporter permease subunit [Agrobacterium tomkonis CIP 111-78]MCJ7996894.1 efflux RND transporter permease subunit [Rhizobium cremeum]MCJ8002112.1 efflux RND transporter permease subunit [Rhizobium cremeum]QCL92641.1 efflux RND transporter permease subunit [Agrobacterium tumefaciens]QCM03511.1 efflux RND transporter permease subunit [Agrobacterium tumefaciens]